MKPRTKTRSRKSPAPSQWFGSFSRGFVLAACAIVPVVLVAAVGRALWESDAFYVKQIDIVGLERLTRDDVLTAALLDQPTSILSCTPERVEELLVAHPWIVDAQVAATWGGLVHIEITEAEPSVLVAGVDGVFLIDSNGEPIRSLQQGDLETYPLLTGVPRLAETGGYDGAVLAEGVEIFTSFVAMGEVVPPARELQYDSVYGWRAVLSDGAEIALGQRPFAPRVARVRDVYSTLRQQGLAAARISVDTESLRQVAVALRGPTGETDEQ